MIEAPTPAELVEAKYVLRVADRCDRCGAQAFVLVTVNDVDLLFCGHHFARHEEALWAVAARVVDEREKINARPSVSANV